MIGHCENISWLSFSCGQEAHMACLLAGPYLGQVGRNCFIQAPPKIIV
jgi:hypothetical protein